MKQNGNNKQKTNYNMHTEDEYAKKERCMDMIQPYLKESEEWFYNLNKKIRIAVACVVMVVVIVPVALWWQNNDFAHTNTEDNIFYADAGIAMQSDLAELKTFCNVGCSQKNVLNTVINAVGITY